MKTVTPSELAQAYVTLFPAELVSPNNTPEQCLEQITGIMGNWMNHYRLDPHRVIRGSNFYGKVTSALFLALDIKQPKTVKAMYEALL